MIGVKLRRPTRRVRNFHRLDHISSRYMLLVAGSRETGKLVVAQNQVIKSQPALSDASLSFQR